MTRTLKISPVLRLGLLSLCLLFSAAAQAGKRVALVVGAGAYVNAPKLPNPPRDARAVATALEKLGFDTTVVIDPDRTGLERAIRAFGQRAEGAEGAVFYYAGHALEAGGRNALLPVSARIQTGRDLPYETIDLDLVLNELDGRTQTLLIFLDSCRDNPFARTLAGAGAGRGVATRGGMAMPANDVSGTLIAFATAPGKTALDGNGDNSPFTTALLHHIAVPGLEVRQMLDAVRKEVREKTSGAQIPWDTSALEGPFFFNPAKVIRSNPTGPTTATPAAVGSMAPRCQRDPVIGMSRPGGASTGLRVQNDGRGCTFSVWRSLAAHRSWDALDVASPPAHGTVTISEGRRVTYTPTKSYSGADRFVIHSTPAGTLEIKVTVTAAAP